MCPFGLGPVAAGIAAYIISAQVTDSTIQSIADKKIFNRPLQDIITFSAVVLTFGIGAAALASGEASAAAFIGLIGIAIAARRLSQGYELQGGWPFYRARPADQP